MKKRKKMPKLNDEQYVAYIMSLKDDAPLYNTDGDMVVPDSLRGADEEEDV